ncbi:hypothetical protein EGW08_001607 [Elysia chlorotica]|uniref:Uncharacterized protein n=1 Tax=Elysia chlorotica TaxID=188477 RepID=A0A3S1BSP2_ELYCH|nr:hypothetical protein EGW08_001607 [Elysia chlorotica]
MFLLMFFYYLLKELLIDIAPCGASAYHQRGGGLDPARDRFLPSVPASILVSIAVPASIRLVSPRTQSPVACLKIGTEGERILPLHHRPLPLKAAPSMGDLDHSTTTKNVGEVGSGATDTNNYRNKNLSAAESWAVLWKVMPKKCEFLMIKEQKRKQGKKKASVERDDCEQLANASVLLRNLDDFITCDSRSITGLFPPRLPRAWKGWIIQQQQQKTSDEVGSGATDTNNYRNKNLSAAESWTVLWKVRPKKCEFLMRAGKSLEAFHGFSNTPPKTSV